MALAREDDEQNMGYVFLTFSHADEARWMAMQTDHPFFEYEPMTIALKGKVDHGDLDDKFFMQRLRNDARLADDYAKL